MQDIPLGGFNHYEFIRHLKMANLVIHTIPGEEWTLSCVRHKTLLVDIYTVTGCPAGMRGQVTFRCGRLCEILLKLLYYKHRVQYQAHEPAPEGANVGLYLSTNRRLADTLEEDFLIRLRSGDLIFCLIPGERWRLTTTCFGRVRHLHFDFFRLAEEGTLGTKHARMFTGNHLEHVLLEFLCQDATFVGLPLPAQKIIPFPGGPHELQAEQEEKEKEEG